MPFLDQADANNVLDAMFQVSNYPSVTSLKIRLGTTIGTATATMTELTGTGYTAGGQACTFGSASAAAISNASTLSWTNGSGSNWPITGLEPWDTAGSPKRHGFGAWTGQPVNVANGNTFQVALGGITAALT